MSRFKPVGAFYRNVKLASEKRWAFMRYQKAKSQAAGFAVYGTPDSKCWRLFAMGSRVDLSEANGVYEFSGHALTRLEEAIAKML